MFYLSYLVLMEEKLTVILKMARAASAFDDIFKLTDR